MFGRFAKTAFFSLVFVALSACSGGGGGGGGQIGPIDPPAGQLVTITEDNAQTVAGVAAQQAVDDNLIGSLFSTGIPVVSAGSQAATDMIAISGPALLPGTAAARIPQDCAISGTVDVDFSVADPNTVTVGDQFTFQFDNCNDGGGAIVSGGLGMTVTGFRGDAATGTILLGMRLELTAFTVSQDGMTRGASGVIDIEIDTTQPPVTTITVSSSALTFDDGSNSETITDLSITIVEDGSSAPSAVTVNTSFRLSTPRLGGDIVVSTSVSLLSSGDEYPFSGELTVTGADGASIRIIAMDSNTARLEVDVNGDGATDLTIDAMWTELMALADAA